MSLNRSRRSHRTPSYLCASQLKIAAVVIDFNGACLGGATPSLTTAKWLPNSPPSNVEKLRSISKPQLSLVQEDEFEEIYDTDIVPERNAYASLR